MHSNFDIHLIVQEVRQLPSPSPTPSPRSSTPALEAAPKLSELTSISNGTNGHKYTTSSDKTMASHDTSDVAFASPSPISKTIPSHELHNILEEKPRKPRKLSIAKINGEVLKLSAAEMEELTSAPESLPVASPVKSSSAQPSLAASPIFERRGSQSDHARSDPESSKKAEQQFRTMNPEAFMTVPSVNGDRRFSAETTPSNMVNRRPGFSNRAISTPPASSARTTSYSKASARQTSPRRKTSSRDTRPEPLEINTNSKPSQNGSTHSSTAGPPPSPMPSSMPLPPMSIPTYLQLELSSSRPSPLYIYRPANSDDPYESSKVKFERLLNFLLLPPQLEQVLYFGSLACLDAWLYTFTILPLRFFKALAILIGWWVETLAREGRFVVGFIYHGAGRFWHRQREGRDGTESAARSRSVSRARRPTASTNPSYQSHTGRILEDVSEHLRMDSSRKTSRQGWGRRHRRTKSVPSSLTSNHKADILQGAVIICSCIILMKFDASRMYHGIRGQAAIKLYVIYNALEVFDKLFSALGQDIFECLFSNETLDRDLDGRSRILRPLGMFILALIYNVIHAAALFYQVIALNVAVNSYSNALLTLLMSNQFVEVKGTVFKMFQKDNLFQLTCADVVERFQLWLMLIIIALRNIVEVGGISIVSGDGGAADVLKDATAPLRSNSILPNSFTILPSWSGEVLAPFILVLGSEMLVDWIKHAYISKFNRVQPAVYQRFLDILAKDYYTNAFVNQNLVKRLGLPVIPLSCLFIRSSVQTYHMFLATHVSPPIPSTATELSVESAIPATTAALEHFDTVIWKALGRSTFGVPDPTATNPWYLPSADDAIAAITMLIVFLVAFLVLLACKLVLGMLLLKFARNRYKTMKSREHQTYNTEGKRIGSWGMVEMEEDKRRHIFADDPETLKKLRDKEKIAKEKAAAGVDFSKVSRYEMSAKRIW
ncbi:eukaryotic membrane protein family-domain-containing protein [Tricladium varicosporioides]|nr:eukaryotic membrane protein family-domain-containing protein [Hymenoscyphus varicosporioides]